MRFRGADAFGMAIVEHAVIEGADAAGGVVVLHRAHEFCFIETELLRQLGQGVGLGAGEHRRHEAADGFGVDDRITDLSRLLRNEAAPDGITLRPEIFALVVETFGIAIEHDAQRDAIHARADAAVVQRRARVDGHAMRLRDIADHVGAGIHHEFEQHAHIETRAANQKIVGGPFSGLVLPPGFAQPFTIGFEAAGGHHAGAGLDAFGADARGDETAVIEFDGVHRRVIANLYAEFFGAAVIGIHQRLAAAHEKGIGARQMQGARQRRLEIYAVFAHPVAAMGGFANRQPRQFFVSQSAGNLEQVLPEFFFGIGVEQHILRRVVHAAQIARVLRIAAAPRLRRGFEQQHRGACLARHQGGAEGGISAADYQHIDHADLSNSQSVAIIHQQCAADHQHRAQHARRADFARHQTQNAEAVERQRGENLSGDNHAGHVCKADARRQQGGAEYEHGADEAAGELPVGGIAQFLHAADFFAADNAQYQQGCSADEE